MPCWLCCFAVVYKGGIGGVHCNVHAVQKHCQKLSQCKKEESLLQQQISKKLGQPIRGQFQGFSKGFREQAIGQQLMEFLGERAGKGGPEVPNICTSE